jgi:CheY-like chemotaxis protein
LTHHDIAANLPEQMPNPRILVVDDDAWILRMVTTVLEKHGYEILTARDGEEGLMRAVADRPDLIITDVMMPKTDGWTLVKALRARPEFALVPVIFLTALGADEDRIRGFRLGADDYLAKPFRFEELDLRVANALRRRTQLETATRQQVRAQPAPTQKEQPGIHGSLDQLGLSSLLVILEMERKSGVLVLQRRGETARIFMREGRILRVRMDGTPVPKNQEAIYYLLTWADGKFEFSILEVQMDDEVQQSTTALLMEGARRIDEARRPD